MPGFLNGQENKGAEMSTFYNKIFRKNNSFKYWIASLFAALFIMPSLTGCGSDDSTGSDYDTALYLSYACTNPDEPLRQILYDNLEEAFVAVTEGGVQEYLYEYYVENGELPSSINLITLKNEGYDIPDGITSGTIYFDEKSTYSWYLDANIELDGFTNNGIDYSGTLKVVDLVATIDTDSRELSITGGTIKASSLSTTCNVDSYQADYSSFTVDVEDADSDYPSLTLKGSVSVYNTDDDETFDLTFSSFYIEQSSDEIDEVSGTFSINDMSYEIDGTSITRDDGDYYWTDGTLTMYADNEDDEDADDDGNVEITVTFDDSTATLTKTSETWDLEDWCEDRLIP
jgi:hypothetical protein